MENDFIENNLLFIIFAESLGYHSDLCLKAFEIYKYEGCNYLTYIQKKVYQLESKILYHTLINDLTIDYIIIAFNAFKNKVDDYIYTNTVNDDLPF